MAQDAKNVLGTGRVLCRGHGTPRTHTGTCHTNSNQLTSRYSRLSAKLRISTSVMAVEDGRLMHKPRTKTSKYELQFACVQRKI